MMTITIDGEMVSELVSVSHFKNAQEAVVKILTDYLQQHKKEPTLFDQLRLVGDYADDDLPLLFGHDNDTGRSVEHRN
jgi:hypothetical protein